MASANLNDKNRIQTRGLGLCIALALTAGTATALAQGDANAGLASMNGAPAGDGAQANSADVMVDDNLTVDLHVKDEELANVLEMLSIQSQKNIIASKDVQASVTANLYGVTFYEALDAILNVNGYGFIEEGNFIKIYTLDELQKIQAASRAKVSKSIGLNYMNAVDAAEFVKPLLSPEGQIKVNGKAQTFPGLSDTPIGDESYAHGSLLVIYDFEENVAQVEEMLRQIDTRPAQVLVEATILQTQLNEDNALGVDFAILADMDFLEVGAPLASVGNLISGGDATNDHSGSAVVGTVGNVASGKAGLKVGIVSNDVSVFIRALDEVTNTTVLSNPKVMALNRQPSRVLVGRKVGYLNTTSTDTATTQTVEFLDTGTQLYFRPFVTNDGLVRMELRPSVSEAAIREVSDVTGAAVTIPDEITNELTTNILVRDGQTVVLGGLFRESVTSSRKQVPLLGNIPIIGHAFRGSDDTTNRNEIIFLVTPTIMNDEMAEEAGDRGKGYIDHIMYGAREGTLFWSRDRLTNNLNIEADRLIREGKTKEAQARLERSLQLNSRQPEVIMLREQLTGVKAPMTNRSFLDRVVDREASKTILETRVPEDMVSSDSNMLPDDPQFHRYDASAHQQTASNDFGNTATTNDAAGMQNTGAWSHEALAVSNEQQPEWMQPDAVLPPLSPDFLSNAAYGENWLGASGFMGNMQTWVRFMQHRQAMEQQSGATLTNVDGDGQ